MDSCPTAVDLFCGAGGLTLGLKQAGFRVVLGVEVDKEISRTYAANHPDTKLLVKDVREVTGSEILKATGLKGIDLVAGCPPCHGFSKLTDKYRREDPRNELLLEMVRLVEEISPRIVMIENVAGLATRGKRILGDCVERLERIGYSVNTKVLQIADFGIPQSRRRFVLLAGKGFRIPMPKQTHCRKGDKRRKLRPWTVLADVIRESDKPVRLSVALKRGGPRKFKWHVVRDLEEISLDRLRSLKQGNGRSSLPVGLRPKCHKDVDVGFSNVYGRMSWGQVSPTITSGCTSPCKGRFGHPSDLRTISVREAALIQTFPKNYKLDTETMETACVLVGNALPPRFAKIVGRACRYSLDDRSV
jgi:DNA (cytosine-5)-methyltransferase 1